jgi:predicted kinase
MKHLILWRGLPGSGKSTSASEMFPDSMIQAADDFFYKVGLDGLEYQFDPSKLSQAHADCVLRLALKLQRPDITVVVTNTFIHLWEMEHYVAIAQAARAKVSIRQFIPTTLAYVRKCHERNVHGLPASVMANMAFEWEDIPDNWMGVDDIQGSKLES